MTFSPKPTVLTQLSSNDLADSQIAYYIDGEAQVCASNESEVVPPSILALAKGAGWPNILRLLVACGAPVGREGKFFPYSLLEPEVLDVNLLSYATFYSNLGKAINLSPVELIRTIKDRTR